MKKHIFIFLIISCFTGCSDFLELYPHTSLNEGNYYQTEAELILLANGCYIPLRNNEKIAHWIIAEMRSDNTSFQKATDGGQWAREACDEFIYASNNDFFATFWNGSYQGITRCNQLLASIGRQGIQWSDEVYKDRSKGEALFLRALYYFNLVRQFGGVPLVLYPITAQEAVKIKRSTVDEIYENIISDLKNAVSHFSLAEKAEEDGRANKGAALSLLGKVYLTRHAFEDAKNILNEVINSGKYSLLDDYADLFDPTNKDYKETIFSVQYSENKAELANNFIFYFIPSESRGEITNRPNVALGNQAGANQPTQDLINSFEAGDLRKDISINYWTGKDWDSEVRAIPYCAKYKPPVSAPDKRCGDNFPILRYADVLLMYAEALNEQNRTEEAIPFVEKVRTRAGLLEPLSGYNKNDLEELIAKERQREFCFENHRWYDLLRTGKALEVMTAHGQRELVLKSYLPRNSFQMEEYKLLAPIPVVEIQRNGIEQNPGY